MKLVRRISFLLILSGVMLGLGGYGALKAEEFFYPNKYQRREEAAGQSRIGQGQTERSRTGREQTEQSRTGSYQTGQGALSGQGSAYAAGKASGFSEEPVIEAAVEKKPVVTADTLYLVETVDLSAGTVDEKEETIPVKYIGLDREELLDELKSYDDSPPLAEQELGFETIELTAFSKDRVVVCKYYRPKKVNRGFYLMVADHFIVVYEEDKKTLYMHTDILLDNLEDSLKREIVRGKYVESEEALYHFLESYSS